jgi:exonuclease III
LLFDILIYEETKLLEDTPDENFKFEGYRLIRRDRGKNHGGGIMLLIREKFELLNEFKYEEFETINLTFKCILHVFSFIISYNPHYQFSGYLSHLETVLHKSLDFQGTTLVFGDLNYDSYLKKVLPYFN